MKFMASHDEAAIPTASCYDGPASDQVGITGCLNFIYRHVFVLVLVVGFTLLRNAHGELWGIATRGILNTSVEHS